MDIEILHTARCSLRPATRDDAGWMIKLFNDSDVVKYIEGIKYFNSDLRTVAGFIETMHINARKGLGVLWCVEYLSNNIGFIMAYDLEDNPFLCFALFPEYRGKGFGKELVDFSLNTLPDILNIKQIPEIETANPVVKAITHIVMRSNIVQKDMNPHQEIK